MFGAKELPKDYILVKPFKDKMIAPSTQYFIFRLKKK